MSASQKDLEIKEPEPFHEDFKSESGDPKRNMSRELALELKEGEMSEEDCKKLAKRMGGIVDNAIERLRPMLEMIDEV